MDKETLEQICEKVQNITRNTGRFISGQLDRVNQKHIEEKGTHNFVTYVDKTAEKQIVEALRQLVPQAGFVAEENTVEYQQNDYMWVVDPLDGTTNFIHGLPCFSISIALMYKNQVQLGVVYEINKDECFYAVKDGPAYLNGKEIHVSQTGELKDSLLATGFPYFDYSRMECYLELFTWCLHNTHGVRRIGSAAVDLVYVACGRFDAFFEYSLSAWDVAAGSFIVQQAGGRVTDFKGKDNYIFGKEIIATNSLICDEFLQKAKYAFR